MSVLSNSDPTVVHRAHLKFNLNDVEVRQQPSISSRLLLARSVCDGVVEFFLHARHKRNLEMLWHKAWKTGWDDSLPIRENRKNDRNSPVR